MGLVLSYQYSRAKGFLTQIITREEFVSIISSEDIESAIKNIVEKPIGIKLYERIRSGKYGLIDLYKTIDHYNRERTLLLEKSVDKRSREILEYFDRLFDDINLFFLLISVTQDGHPYIIYPTGKLMDVDLSNVKDPNSLKEALPSNLRPIVEKYLAYGISSIAELFNLYGEPKYYMIMNQKVRKVYGFIHDSLLIRNCFYLDEVPQNILFLSSLTRRDFIEICSSKKLIDAAQVMRGVNPMYNGFSSLLSDLFNISSSIEIFDLGVVLYSTYISSDLILGRNFYIKIYLLYLAEAFLLKSILSSIVSELYVEEYKNIVNRWWIL